MSPFFLQYEESKSRLELSPQKLRHQAAISSASTPVLVFIQRRLSNLRCRASIWHGSWREWIVCVCVYWWRGGDYRMQCIVGNVVLEVAPLSCHFAGWLCASCEAFAGFFFCFVYFLSHWFCTFSMLGSLWVCCRPWPVTAGALRQAVPCRWHLDYKGFMKANRTTSVPLPWISFFFKKKN